MDQIRAMTRVRPSYASRTSLGPQPEARTRRRRKVKPLWRGAVLLGLCFAGMWIKIPSPIDTITLDAFPAYLGAIFFNGFEGLIIGVIAEFATAAVNHFPLGFLAHVIIALETGLCCLAFYLLVSKLKLGTWPAGMVTVILHGIGIPLSLALLFGRTFFTVMVKYWLAGAALNILCAVLLYRLLGKRRRSA